MLPLEYNNSRMMSVHRIRAVKGASNIDNQIDTSRNKHLGINLETISSKVSQESLLKTDKIIIQ